MRHAYLAGVVAVLTIAACVPSRAAPPVTYVRLTCSPGAEGIVYLRLENNKLQLARTAADVEKASVIRAKDAKVESQGKDNAFQNYVFPNVALPVSLPGITKVTADFTYNRSRYKQPRQTKVQEYVGVNGDVVLVVRDSKGTEWGYVFSVYSGSGGDATGRGGQPSGDAQHPFVATVPKLDLSKLSFDITPQVEGRNARIGMKIKSGSAELNNVLKGGKSTPVTLEVLDKNGRAVKTEKGDPKKFGFT